MPRRSLLTPTSTAVLVMVALTLLGLASLWAGPTAGVLVGLLVALVGLLLWRTGGGRLPAAVGLGVAASGVMVVVLALVMWGYLLTKAHEPVRPERDPGINRVDPVLTTPHPGGPITVTTARP